MAKKGDMVRVSKTVMGSFYQASGKITRTLRYAGEQLVEVDGDWWRIVNDGENSFKITAKAPTQQQRSVASAPHNDSLSCHYCGMPATSFGFFDEPVCRECGG